MAPSATFRLTSHELRRAVDRITRLRFDREPSRSASVSLLDTSDGSLRRAGLQVEIRDCGGIEIVLFDQRSVTAAPLTISVESVPVDASSLPEGPARDAVTQAIGTRRLRARASVVANSTRAVARNRAGDVTATAVMFEEMRSVGRRSIDESTVLIEIRGIDGHSKRALRAIEALEHQGLERVGALSLASVVEAVGADVRPVRGAAKVPLDPAMAAADGFRDVLDSLAATIEANLPGVIDRSGPEFLHQLRVAVRRSRSVLAQGRNVLPSSLLEYGHEQLTWLGSVTGAARNLDVHLIEWNDRTDGLDRASMAALEPIHVMLEERCAQAYATLADDLRAAEQAELMAQWRVRLREPAAAAASHSHRRLSRVVTKALADAQAKMLLQGRAIDHDSPPEALHALRKDAKKLRYLLECFGEVMPERRRRAFVKRLKDLQNNLGEYHDTHVFISDLVSLTVEAHDQGVAPETTLAVGRLIERVDQRHREARLGFEDRFAAYDSTSTRLALEELLRRVGR